MATAQVRELPTPRDVAITTEIIRITPAMAEKMLGKNVRNRHIRARVVEKYRRAMVAGEWTVTGEAIKFASNGDLLDGQHRLSAIIESGKTVSMIVVKGLPSSSQDVMDTGIARTTGDQLGIAGYADPNALAAAARAVILYESGQLSSKLGPSTPQIRDLVDGNTLLVHATSRARAISKGCDLRPAVAAMTFYELMKVDDEAAQLFFDRLTDGVNLPAGSPILALRSRLRTARDDRAHLPIDVLTSLVMRTWNAWRMKRTVTALPLYRRGELIPCPEPK